MHGIALGLSCVAPLRAVADGVCRCPHLSLLPGAQPQTFLNPERAQNASPAAEAIADTGAAMASERAL
ncbi:hypothetical protein BN10_1250011 [Phycicoccus elongatus Lp2]|uniref:Uncharacterized protein n=1 Tax=Phycicoccus elongatus Lp2 TaxID=1193181 RepID=N0DXQ7_9MICO|nr:hypothetical protein BN10_1250011 [Phycicoccus elongatus Lp2]